MKSDLLTQLLCCNHLPSLLVGGFKLGRWFSYHAKSVTFCVNFSDFRKKQYEVLLLGNFSDKCKNPVIQIQDSYLWVTLRGGFSWFWHGCNLRNGKVFLDQRELCCQSRWWISSESVPHGKFRLKFVYSIDLWGFTLRLCIECMMIFTDL